PSSDTPATAQPRRIAEIVLTGGPSAGKTSALAHLAAKLTEKGWRVLLVPEAATQIIVGGVGDIGELAQRDRDRFLAVEAELLRLQLDLRERFRALAEALGDAKTVLLHDRGALDNLAYMTGEEFETVCTAVGVDAAELAGLYDAVVHLRSAAFATG